MYFYIIALRRDLSDSFRFDSDSNGPLLKYRSPGVTSYEWTDCCQDDDPNDPDFPNVQNGKYKYTEGFLDGPYDFAYSRVDSYMDTSGASSSKYGMKAQMLSFAPGNTSRLSRNYHNPLCYSDIKMFI